MNNKLVCSLALVALLVALDWSQAQKTIKRQFQQQISSSNSQLGNPNSVYGGYQTGASNQRTQQTSLVAPVQQQQRYSSSSSVQQSSSVLAPRPNYQQQQSTSYQEEQTSDQSSADAEPASYGSVNGQPGKDFPAYTRVPKTSFTCDGLPYDYGMYADEETGCQAYHVCYNGRKDSFLCGVGTVFNQRILHCDYWYSVDCGKSSQYYSSNAYMGSSQPEPGPAQASGSSSSTSYSKRTQVSQVEASPVRVNQQAVSSNQWSRNSVQQQKEEAIY